MYLVTGHMSLVTSSMNWEMLAAIGQLAAVFVGIPSLIYLATQIREQTKERRQAAVHALNVQWGDLTNALHDSAELSAIFLRGLQSFVDLDPVSKLRFSAFFMRFLNYFEGMYLSHRDGLLTAASWGKIERTMSDLIAYPGLQQWWKTRKHWHTEEFARVVDAISAKGEKPKAYATYDLSELTKKVTSDKLTELARRYAEAWCSQNPAKVAAFYAKDGSISVNGAPPVPIAEVARGFMHGFPDMVVTFDKLETTATGTEFHWTFTGTNSGPDGTGNKVRISGYELWKIDNHGLISESKGHFDAADYEGQLKKK